MEKYETLVQSPSRTSSNQALRSRVAWLGLALVTVAVACVSLYSRGVIETFRLPILQVFDVEKAAKVVRNYDLTIGFTWANLDGGRWRPMFVCNGQAPCPTLEAEEGDDINIHVTNDLGAQLSIHWSGMNHRRYGFWNDGTGGLNQYPILPRGNWTSKYDTTGHWGLNWYADHTGAGVADGVYGTVYVAPSPKRPRPYHLITDDRSELASIHVAEKRIKHMSLWNSDFRTAQWKLDKMKGTGAIGGLYCYKSILVNGKGRVFCKNPEYAELDGQKLDDAGCLIQPGYSGQPCKPSVADLEIIDTNGQSYLMLNVINIGFEHALKYSIDDHQMWVVATDAGFVEPQRVDVVYVTSGSRKTILIKLDQGSSRKLDGDYAIRIASTSKMQNLEGMAILRYPAKRYPMIGRPTEIPITDQNTKVCLNPDSSVRENCEELNHASVRPYPIREPPKKSDLTLKWAAESRQSKHMEHVTEYLVNEEPWQLFRAAQEPVFFTKDANNMFKPVQGGLAMGTVVDLIVQNTLNDTIPMYKHGDPTFFLGSGENEMFKWESVDEAAKDGAVNLKDPSLDLVHDLPPLGWIALRWKVNLRGATMFHAVKLRYFALGMAAPMLEGFEKSMENEIPEYARNQPHIVFEPANNGVFG